MTTQLLDYTIPAGEDWSGTCGHCDDGPCMPGCEPPYDNPAKIINKIVPIDWVANPPHYNQAGIEVIDVIEAYAPTNYHLGNVIKYVCRSGHKGHEIEDLKKARWYLDRYIATHE